MPTKRPLKEVFDLFRAEVAEALDEARAAGRKTWDDALRRNPRLRKEQGFDYYMHWLYVTDLTPRLRKALKSLGAERCGVRHMGWTLPVKVDLPLSGHHEPYSAALRAACGVLNKRFPDDGVFKSHSWLSD